MSEKSASPFKIFDHMNEIEYNNYVNNCLSYWILFPSENLKVKLREFDFDRIKNNYILTQFLCIMIMNRSEELQKEMVRILYNNGIKEIETNFFGNLNKICDNYLLVKPNMDVFSKNFEKIYNKYIIKKKSHTTTSPSS